MAAALELRPETAADREGIREVVAAAFGRADEAELIEALGEAGDAVVSLVAAEAGRAVGHVLLSRLAAPFPALALGPVAVAPGHQRRGIGSRLVRAGLEDAARGGWLGVFVLGEPGFYGRFGFTRALASGFASPYAGPHLLACALGGGLPVTTGRIDYPAAFARLG